MRNSRIALALKPNCGALLKGLELIKDEGMAMVQAELDFQLAAKMVNEGSSPTALTSNPASECRAMVDEIGSSPHTVREGNKVADKLAKMGV